VNKRNDNGQDDEISSVGRAGRVRSGIRLDSPGGANPEAVKSDRKSTSKPLIQSDSENVRIPLPTRPTRRPSDKKSAIKQEDDDCGRVRR
jgi:hypothetical protein